MSHYSILETKLGNDKLWNPEFWYEHKDIIVIKQKDMKIMKIKLEMGHNRISKVGIAILKR